MPRLRDVVGQLDSPYLASHADNPVDWWQWGDDAFAEARRLDRPVFVSIGYAACHWCHVMAHESFEDPSVAAALNGAFVSIKVDREERPDVDALYMAATQLIAGQGGWPMSVFALPDGRPFFAGTYYPPVDRGGQVGFARLVAAMADAWRTRRVDVEAQAADVERAIARELDVVDHLAPHLAALDLVAVRRRLRDELVTRVETDGGFSGPPKFPRPAFVEALVEFDDADSRDAVARTLDAMARGGLYDHLAGGFARYSVDARWRVPHFEKMLSDQALLARAYLRAGAVFANAEWREVALETLRFVVRDLAVPGGYAASLDADAGGVEGSHVTWTPSEVRAALRAEGLDALIEPALARWGITDVGDLDGRSVPHLGDGSPWATPGPLRAAAEALVRARAARPQPARDDKVILEWNAMFAGACLASGDGSLAATGLTLLHGLASTHHREGAWWRTGAGRIHATAADLAWLTDAALDAFEHSGDDQWIVLADEVAAYLVTHHWDGTVASSREPAVGGGLYTSSDQVTDLSRRSKEIFDGATPSATSVAVRALARLALVTGDQDRLAIARRLVDLAATLIATHPSAVPDLVGAAGFATEGIEIVVPGGPNHLSDHVRSIPVNRAILVTGSGASPLLGGRRAGFAYVCRSGVCQLPVATIEELDAELGRWR